MMPHPKPLLILVDASSYFFRAFHALPALTTSQGEPTGAIYGVINMLKRLFKDYQLDYLAIVFDSKGQTFRSEIYADYKAHRPTLPDELAQQFHPLISIIQAMGLPVIIAENVEADDVIGTLAVNFSKQNIHTFISTGDKDLTQLVNDKVSIIDTMNNVYLDESGVLQKFGVAPERIVDYLTLVGDKVDNIPGIANVGPKTAVKWLNEYGTLDNLVQHAAEIKGKIGENLRAGLSQLEWAKKLVVIKTDVPLNLSLEKFRIRTPNTEELKKWYQRFEFRAWLEEALGNTPALEAADSQYETILTKKDFSTWLKRLEKSKFFAFDTETTSLNALQAELVGLSFSDEAGYAAYVPLAHDYEGAPTQLAREEVLAALKPLLEDENKPKIIAQNAKYDMNVLSQYGIDLKGLAFDTMLESYILNSSANRHDMDSLALKYLGRKTIHYEEVAGTGSKQKKFNQIELTAAAPYAAEDADVTLQLHQKFLPKLDTEKKLMQVFKEVEMPLIPVLARMEQRGVLIDSKFLKIQSVETGKLLDQLEKQAHELAGKFFNLNSPKQLQTILFEELKLPIIQRTPTGQASTGEEVLAELAQQYLLPKVILRYRSLSKLKSTYIDALPAQINLRTGRVHTCYNQAIAATGRLSSTEPNLQNIPIKNPEGRKIRQAFIAAPGYKILAADYSQIELRIMAHLADEPTLKNAFAHGEDIHRATAAEVFNVATATVSDQQRRHAKAINFGLMYGMSAFGLAKQLNVERREAQIYMDNYFNRYPKVKAYMENTRIQAQQQGYVETLMGRRLYLPDIQARHNGRQKAAERAAINAPLQGTAADIIKKAMIEVDRVLQTGKLDAFLIMQVHDELVFEVAEKDIAALSEMVRDVMRSTTQLTVPLEVDIGVGNNWDEAH